MSSFYRAHDSHYLILNTNGHLNQIEKSFLEMRFDQETEYDFQLARKEVETIKQLKKMCFLKLITFLPEAFIANIIYSKKENKARQALNRVYFKFLFNKIDYNTFKKELTQLSKDDIMLV